MTKQLLESAPTTEEEIQPLSEIMCNCELCYARLCVSAKQTVEDEQAYDPCLVDNFNLPLQSKSSISCMPFPCAFAGCPTSRDMCVPKNFQLTRLPYNVAGIDNFLHVHPPPEWLQRYKMASHAACEGDVWMTAMSPSPQLYLSKDSVLHLRISAYVALERSGTAFRLINYRNNSALALSENGEYGFAYHYNCRGLINMHHEKLSITFDKDRQILLRTEKPSFVKKENEYYRLTSHHWTQCRPVLMDFFDRDKTPEILKKSGPDKAIDEAKLTDLINSSVMQKDATGLTRDARIETRLNGDVTLSWMYGEQINSLVVSPLTGGVSLSARNLEIIATAKNDIYIAFADFFVHTRSQQMTVSSGAISGRGTYSKSHPCLLKLTSTTPENQMSDIRQFCSYMYNEHHQGQHQGGANNTTAAVSGGAHRHGGSHSGGTANQGGGQSQGETPIPSGGGRPAGDARRSRHSSSSADVVTLSESPAKENSSSNETRK